MVKSDKCMGVSQLLGTCAWAAPKVNAYVSKSMLMLDFILTRAHKPIGVYAALVEARSLTLCSCGNAYALYRFPFECIVSG